MSFLNTFIRIAPDCPENEGIEPPVRGGKKPVHLIHLELLRDAPYQLTHEDLLVKGESLREPPSGETKTEIRARLREKSLPCLRTSALGKRYGGDVRVVPGAPNGTWGICSGSEARCRSTFRRPATRRCA